MISFSTTSLAQIWRIFIFLPTQADFPLSTVPSRPVCQHIPLPVERTFLLLAHQYRQGNYSAFRLSADWCKISVCTNRDTASIFVNSLCFHGKRQKALSYEWLPTAKGFLIWISFATQPLVNHSVTHKPPDYKNNGFCMAVIKLLSKDFLNRRKPS